VVCDANGVCLGGCVDGYSGDNCLTGEKCALKGIIANQGNRLNNGETKSVLKMLGLYLDTIIIGHTFCKKLSILL